MWFNMFTKFLTKKAHGSWSADEVIDIFKRRYGDSYDIALANMLMDSLQTYTKEPRLSKQDKEYAEAWRDELKAMLNGERKPGVGKL